MIDTNYNGLSLYEETGFIGLFVEGRKTADVQIETAENVRDGVTFRSKKITERTITVTGFISANTEYELMQKYDTLMGILVSDPCKIIFSDEDDKYFTGMFETAKIEKEGRTANTVSLQFLCPDPHKYSLFRKEFSELNGYVTENTDGTLTVNVENNGTVDVPVSYELTMNHENGYVGIASDNGAMEFGSIEEADTASGNESQMLLNLQNGTAIRSAFKAGVNPITTGSFAYNGTLGVDGEWLKLTGNGSGSGWHGAGGQIDIPADINGEVGAKSFKVSYKPWFATHKTYVATGDMEIVVGDEDGNLLCDVHIVKSSTSNNNAGVRFNVQGHGDVYKSTYEPRSDKGITREDGAEVWFAKTGELFEVCWNGKVQQFRFPELAEKKAKTLNVFFGVSKNTAQIFYMRLKYLKFSKTNVEYFFDIPNRYASGDVLKIDGEKGQFTVNDNPQSDEVIGSTYVKAKAGDTTETIVSVSSFSTPLPTVKAFIREAWL